MGRTTTPSGRCHLCSVCGECVGCVRTGRGGGGGSKHVSKPNTHVRRQLKWKGSWGFVDPDTSTTALLQHHPLPPPNPPGPQRLRVGDGIHRGPHVVRRAVARVVGRLRRQGCGTLRPHGAWEAPHVRHLHAAWPRCQRQALKLLHKPLQWEQREWGEAVGRARKVVSCWVVLELVTACPALPPRLTPVNALLQFHGLCTTEPHTLGVALTPPGGSPGPPGPHRPPCLEARRTRVVVASLAAPAAAAPSLQVARGVVAYLGAVPREKGGREGSRETHQGAHKGDAGALNHVDDILLCHDTTCQHSTAQHSTAQHPLPPAAPAVQLPAVPPFPPNHKHTPWFQQQQHHPPSQHTLTPRPWRRRPHARQPHGAGHPWARHARCPRWPRHHAARGPRWPRHAAHTPRGRRRPTWRHEACRRARLLHLLLLLLLLLRGAIGALRAARGTHGTRRGTHVTTRRAPHVT
jgi:hypothetical protein